MGLISALLGNATEVDGDSLEKEFSELLVSGENIKHAYKLFRDLIVFTEKRMIMVDKQGLTGKKREYVSIPYSSISVFSKETAGRLDFDAEIKLYVRGLSTPVTLEFRKDNNVHDVYRVISGFVIK